jgi:hypothetical protein
MAKKADELEVPEKPDVSESKDILPINVTDLLGIKGSFGEWGTKIIENFSKAVGFVFTDRTQVGRAKREAEAKSIPGTRAGDPGPGRDHRRDVPDR